MLFKVETTTKQKVFNQQNAEDFLRGPSNKQETESLKNQNQSKTQQSEKNLVALKIVLSIILRPFAKEQLMYEHLKACLLFRDTGIFLL